MSGSELARLLDGGPRLTVGMITADLASLGGEIGLLESGGVEMVHVDVADGVFCPLFTVGPPVVKAIRTPILKDVHLMIDDPLEKVEAFVGAGADMITFHVEGARQPHRVLQVLRDATNVNDPARGIIRGVGINPSTPLEVLEPLLDGVSPGALAVGVEMLVPLAGEAPLPDGAGGRRQRGERRARDERVAHCCDGARADEGHVGKGDQEALGAGRGAHRAGEARAHALGGALAHRLRSDTALWCVDIALASGAAALAWGQRVSARTDAAGAATERVASRS